jgi:hypothetical protein
MSNRGLMITSDFLPIPKDSWVTVVFKKYDEDGEQLYTITTETDGLSFLALRSPGTRDGVVGRDYELLEDPA